MKLYTEELVINLIQAINPKISTDEVYTILKALTFIKIPSDEEIDAISKKIAHDYFNMHNTNHYKGLEEGAWRMAYYLMEYFKKQEK